MLQAEEKKQMLVTYLGHSGFLAELEDVYLLFDYYTGRIPVLVPEKPLVVFASHAHPDHYHKKIWNLSEGHGDTYYVLSDDIPFLQDQIPGARVLSVAADRKYTLGVSGGTDLAIETMESTDEGVAFWVTCQGQTLYHAGDLNLWLWAEEGDAWNQAMEQAFEIQLQKMKGRRADVAFLPLDPGQEAYAFAGMDAYLKTIEAKHVFPMHFWGKYKIIQAYLDRNMYDPKHTSIHRIEKKGQQFWL